MARKKTSSAAKAGEFKTFNRVFQSVNDLANYCDQTPALSGDASRRENGVSFSGVENWQGAMRIAREGWHEGAALVKAGLQKETDKRGSKEKSRRIVRVYDVAGEEPDVARYLSGDPENMIENRRAIKKGKTVRVIRAGVSFSAQVSADIVKEYAVAIACAVQRIENSGNRVELWAEKCTAESIDCNGDQFSALPGVVFTASVKIKSAESRIAPASIAGAFHPSFQRRFMFALLEREAGASFLALQSYGYSANKGKQAGYLTSRTAFQSNSQVREAIAEINKAA